MIKRSKVEFRSSTAGDVEGGNSANLKKDDGKRTTRLRFKYAMKGNLLLLIAVIVIIGKMMTTNLSSSSLDYIITKEEIYSTIDASSPRTWTIEEQNNWIKTKFVAADPTEQDWCVRALKDSLTFWKRGDYDGGSQFGGDVFTARNIFWNMITNNKKGYYVEAGANEYRFMSDTFFYDKCLGWNGLCIEPQRQYQDNLRNKRSCKVIDMCLTKEDNVTMMIGGMPSNRGGGAYIKPLPSDTDVIPETFEKVQCSSLKSMIEEDSFSKEATTTSGKSYHIDYFILDVEGAEEIILDNIDWSRIKFSVLKIETNKIKDKEKLHQNMLQRGYEKRYSSTVDTIYEPIDSLKLLSTETYQINVAEKYQYLYK